MRTAIPLAGPGPLVRTAHWTWVARILLALALVGTLVAAFLASRTTERKDSLLPASGSPIVALDLSWSVTSRKSELVGRALEEIARSGRPVGLVLFSDTAYAALPPGTQPEALQPFIRFFNGKTDINPWQGTFSAGTQIGGALDRARRMLHDAGIKDGSVTLISDLDNAPNDQTNLSQMVITYEREGIPIRMIALNPNPEDVRFFREALRPGGGTVTTLRSGTPPAVAAETSSAFPVALVVAAGLLALLIALNEQVLGRLSWGRRTA